jgi:hypothetical protein
MDRPTKPERLVMHVAAFAVAVAAIRVWRTAWMLENIIAIIVRQTLKKSTES